MGYLDLFSGLFELSFCAESILNSSRSTSDVDLCSLENYFDIASVYFLVKCNICIFFGLINLLHDHSFMNGNTTKINK